MAMKSKWRLKEPGGEMPRHDAYETRAPLEPDDRVDAYIARLHEVTPQLISSDEIERRLLASKVEVARRLTIDAHRAAAAQHGPLRPRSRDEGVAARKVANLVGDIMSLWLVATVVSISLMLSLGSIKAVTGCLSSAVVLAVMWADSSYRSRQYTKKASCPLSDPPWWHERMRTMAEHLGSRRPGHLTRAVDIGFAFSALLLTAPTLLIALALALVRRRPAWDRQPRVGQGGQIFTRYTLYVRRNEDGTPATPMDRILMRSGIEHLPRLWNLLVGDLTLVGPKPENPAIAVQYPRSCRWVFEHRPGLTGPVSRGFRDWMVQYQADAAQYLTLVVPEQVAFDKNFIAMSRRRRLPIMLRAIGLLLQPIIVENACLRSDLRDQHTSRPGGPDSLPSSAEPSIHEEREPTAIRVTKWCRHEVGPALA
jgi:lipopolysaccharide/colanic/teichoic acid biosynthesis glycosyltransferase